MNYMKVYLHGISIIAGMKKLKLAVNGRYWKKNLIYNGKKE